jgi:hypothetical protein
MGVSFLFGRNLVFWMAAAHQQHADDTKYATNY